MVIYSKAMIWGFNDFSLEIAIKIRLITEKRVIVSSLEPA